MPAHPIIEELKNCQPNQVIPFDPSKDKLVSMDLGSGNNKIEQLMSDPHLFNDYIDKLRAEAGARYGVGGYGELRSIYGQSRLFDGKNEDEEPRRLHLGIDIWGKPHTAVMAPLDGLVHSFAFNNHFGDYGATVIITHALKTAVLHTLYGHLSLSSIKNLEKGQHIEKGEIFAEFGIPAENGHWPPHLHFQLILNLGNYNGDYPGVCRVSEKEAYLSNSPDPDLLLRMNRYLPV